MCRLSGNLGVSNSWNPQGLSRLVMELLYLFIRISVICLYSLIVGQWYISDQVCDLPLAENFALPTWKRSVPVCSSCSTHWVLQQMKIQSEKRKVEVTTFRKLGHTNDRNSFPLYSSKLPDCSQRHIGCYRCKRQETARKIKITYP
jgi:hypothetical protein